MLVLLPGLDGTGKLFRPLLDVLPPGLPTRVLSYPTDLRLPYDALLDLVEKELRSERQLLVVAESFSGPLALRFAAAHPERVRAVVLCASFIRSPVPRWLRYLANRLIFHLPIPNFAVRFLLVGTDAPDELVAEVKQAIQTVRPEVLAGRVREVLTVNCRDALQHYAGPVLYIRAASDFLVRRASAEAVLFVRPDVRISTIEAPHLLLQRAPRAAWREITAFLSAAACCDSAAGE